jgi:2-oxoglutarate ferredoxin oxidoreductase subunit alpha
VSGTLLTANAEAVDAGTEPIVNDLTIHVATVNGSGSQSSNNVLMRSIFQMGVPVSGKNMFPSNIAGLPTWFTIRANKDGWIGRKLASLTASSIPAIATSPVDSPRRS